MGSKGRGEKTKGSEVKIKVAERSMSGDCLLQKQANESNMSTQSVRMFGGGDRLNSDPLPPGPLSQHFN